MSREGFYKILIIGPTGTGKTSIMHRFVDDTYLDNRPVTMGCDFKMTVVDHLPRISEASERLSKPALGAQNDVSESFVAGQKTRKPFTLQLWDIAGQDRNVQVVRSFFAGAVGAVVVCDASRESTLEEAVHWRGALKTANVNFRRSTVPIPVVLVVNKCDLLVQGGGSGKHQQPQPSAGPFSDAALKAFCERHDFFDYVFTSAKENIRVDHGFRRMIDAVVDTSIHIANGRTEPEIRQRQEAIRFDPQVAPTKKKKCDC